MSCEWLTIKEAANYIKVHYTTIQKYISSGKLKVSRPGGKIVRICLEDLQEFMEGNG
jgi:excisionase family DNA binding protein